MTGRLNQPLGGHDMPRFGGPATNTALLAENLLFEMLCVIPGVAYRE